MLLTQGDLIPVEPEATGIPWTRRKSQILNYLHRGPVDFTTLVYDTNVGDISAISTYFNPDRVSVQDLNLKFGQYPSSTPEEDKSDPADTMKPRLLLYPEHNQNQMKAQRTLTWVLSHQEVTSQGGGGGQYVTSQSGGQYDNWSRHTSGWQQLHSRLPSPEHNIKNESGLQQMPLNLEQNQNRHHPDNLRQMQSSPDQLHMTAHRKQYGCKSEGRSLHSSTDSLSSAGQKKSVRCVGLDNPLISSENKNCISDTQYLHESMASLSPVAGAEQTPIGYPVPGGDLSTSQQGLNTFRNWDSQDIYQPQFTWK